jgi:hypothetical protein
VALSSNTERNSVSRDGMFGVVELVTTNSLGPLVKSFAVAAFKSPALAVLFLPSKVGVCVFILNHFTSAKSTST